MTDFHENFNNTIARIIYRRKFHSIFYQIHLRSSKDKIIRNVKEKRIKEPKKKKKEKKENLLENKSENGRTNYKEIY